MSSDPKQFNAEMRKLILDLARRYGSQLEARAGREKPLKAARALTAEEAAEGNCFGSFGTLGSVGGCAGTFGTYGCALEQEGETA
jgi:hypothetical protein